MAIRNRFGCFACNFAKDVVYCDFGLKMRNRPGLGGWHIRVVTDQKDSFCNAGLQRQLVGSAKTQAITQARIFDQVGTVVRRYHDQQVVPELAAVGAGNAVAGNAAQVGIGDDADALFFQQVAEHLVAYRLGERAIHRRDVRDLRPVSQSAFPQVLIGQKRKFNGCDRAFDRCFRDIDENIATLEIVQRLGETHGAVGRVKAMC